MLNHSLQGQHASIKGRFEVDFLKGCEGLLVNITRSDNASAEYWYEGLNPSVPTTNALSHTYTAAGIFYIVQLDNSIPTGTDRLDSIKIEILDSDNLNFKVHLCSDYGIQVEVLNSYFDKYLVEYGTSDNETITGNSFTNTYRYGMAGNFTLAITGLLDIGMNNCKSSLETVSPIDILWPPTLKSIEVKTASSDGLIELSHELNSSNSYTLNSNINTSEPLLFDRQISSEQTLISVNTENAFHCYQISTYDACEDKTYYSEKACSIQSDAVASDSGNVVSWQTVSVEGSTISVIRNNNVITTLTNNDNEYIDASAICKVSYDYQIIAAIGNVQSISAKHSISTASSGSLVPISLPYSTFEGDSLLIQWNKPIEGSTDFETYIIERKLPGKEWSSWKKTSETEARLQASGGEYAYRIRYSDLCENTSDPSPTTTPIYLRLLDRQGRKFTFDWTKYDSWLSGTKRYVLEELDGNSQLLNEYPVLSGRRKTIEVTHEYKRTNSFRIKSESLDQPTRSSYSYNISAGQISEMFVPSAFTPDNDGINDILLIQGSENQSFKFLIFNRWGNMVFQSNNPNISWDGKIKNQPAPEGVYIYKLVFTDQEGYKFDQEGVISLFRNL